MGVAQRCIVGSITQCFDGLFWCTAQSSASSMSTPTPQNPVLLFKISPCLSRIFKSQRSPTPQICGWEPDPIPGHSEGCDSLLAQPFLYKWSTRTTHSSEHHQSEGGHCFHHFVSFTKMTVLSFPHRAGHLPVLTLPSVLQTPIHALTK